MADTDRTSVLQRALEACVTGNGAQLPELFTADVSGWSPNLRVTSLDELTEAVAEREEALSDVKVQVNAVDVFGDKGFMEYHLSAVFSGPFYVDDDTSIEPNGREITVGAALVAEFADGKVSGFRNYFDNAALMEQMLSA